MPITVEQLREKLIRLEQGATQFQAELLKLQRNLTANEGAQIVIRELLAELETTESTEVSPVVDLSALCPGAEVVS